MDNKELKFLVEVELEGDESSFFIMDSTDYDLENSDKTLREIARAIAYQTYGDNYGVKIKDLGKHEVRTIKVKDVAFE